MKQWNNAQHEDALRLRRLKNEEKKYVYRRALSTSCFDNGVNQDSTVSKDFDGEPYGNPKYVRVKK